MAKSTCSIDGCGEPVIARGWCSSHYARWSHGGDPARDLKRPQTTRNAEYNRDGLRLCTGCDEWKPLDEYETPGCRHQARCRECRREAMREYSATRREEAADRARRWRRENPAKAKALNLAWEQKNPERYAEMKRRLALRRYYRKMANWVEDVDRATVFERDGGLCGLCGRLVDPDAFEVDHIIPLSKDGEHSYANVQLAHVSCNRRKSNRTGYVAP